MTEIHRIAAVLVVALAASVPPALAEDAGPFAFKAPAPGTVLVYSDGFQITFGKTEGRVTHATAGPKSAPAAASVEFVDAFMMRRLARGARTLTVKIKNEKPGFWPLRLGATQRFRMDISADGKPQQSQRVVAQIAKKVSELTLAGKTRRVVRVDTEVRWKGRNGEERRSAISYFHDLDLGFYVKRLYTRYGPEGKPRTPQLRELASVRRVTVKPKR
ncbi:MAG TPA: hypothetical protein VM325_13990 [Alphaproteobacteria bacterium]|nr:hypothetical protein [Alphaproteobacteria bacterium]